jgi:hypothetical protein
MIIEEKDFDASENILPVYLGDDKPSYVNKIRTNFINPESEEIIPRVPHKNDIELVKSDLSYKGLSYKSQELLHTLAELGAGQTEFSLTFTHLYDKIKTSSKHKSLKKQFEYVLNAFTRLFLEQLRSGTTYLVAEFGEGMNIKIKLPFLSVTTKIVEETNSLNVNPE